jgi:hypothetical protein
MDKIEKTKTDKLVLSTNNNSVIIKAGKDSMSLPAELTQSGDGAWLVVVLIFFAIMLMPAHIGAAMVFAAALGMCWQLKRKLGVADERIEQLEKLLTISGQSKKITKNDSKELLD